MKKTVLVTGASRGIGAEIAREFANAGYDVVVNYLNNIEKAESLAKEIGGVAVKADVSDFAQVESMIKEAEKLYTVMGERFTQQSGKKYFVISPHDEFERFFGREADKRRKLYNGMIKCQLFMYFKHK